MKVIGNFEFLGIEEIQGKKDPSKTFYNVVLLQDMDSIKVFANFEDVIKFEGFKKLDKLQCALDIKVGAKTYINIIDVKKI